jgi:thiopeptide-type bacteriocin biosynthesis protein
VYRNLPVTVAGALAVQLSFPPTYPHAENVCRIPGFTDHVLRFGEHHRPDPADITLGDLAILATYDRLYLVSMSRQQVIEPQVLHALAMQKQPPPLVRFLAHLARGSGALWTEVDWGPHCADLPFLPRLRYRRSIIAPARWQLSAAALPSGSAATSGWETAFVEWRARWRLPDVVELRDDDRTLRLDLTVPAHRVLLRQHLDQQPAAAFTEAPGTVRDFGWAAGHVHEIAMPFVTARPPAPSPLPAAPVPVIRNGHGHPPGSPQAPWLQVKVFTHPERMDELIADHLPRLATLVDGDPRIWFVRYRSPLELPHLRLRLHTPTPDQAAACVAAVGRWARQLRDQGLIGQLLIDTYHPEVGRYGEGPALNAAEQVFAADSALVGAVLRHRRAIGLAPQALAAVSMVSLATGFLGEVESAMRWLSSRSVLTGPTLDRACLQPVLALTTPGTDWALPHCPPEVAAAQARRDQALAGYADHVSDRVLDPLLHLHHNRLLGIDPGSEHAARRIARHAAVAWLARRELPG